MEEKRRIIQQRRLSATNWQSTPQDTYKSDIGLVIKRQGVHSLAATIRAIMAVGIRETEGFSEDDRCGCGVRESTKHVLRATRVSLRMVIGDAIDVSAVLGGNGKAKFSEFGQYGIVQAVLDFAGDMSKRARI